ncbi:hypothetical protein [Limosilactobacillus reuteri]|uniref:hypothetical protein n=1 Tax=Limosilactobacillus reuteri TaxID=1598 RepID=UPI001E3FA92C|nr:hypothetical protein [Limosilactobacillus reuteri]MCC4514664.1 hypothetical protein [Limosilactobacillus reuteri]
MFFRQNKSPFDSFLDSLTYWQKKNLYTVLQLGQTNLSYEEADYKAIIAKDEDLRFLLEKTLNSPDPKM